MNRPNRPLRKTVRNQEIVKRLQAGDSLSDVAALYGITSSRVRQILYREQRWAKVLPPVQS